MALSVSGDSSFRLQYRRHVRRVEKQRQNFIGRWIPVIDESEVTSETAGVGMNEDIRFLQMEGKRTPAAPGFGGLSDRLSSSHDNHESPEVGAQHRRDGILRMFSGNPHLAPIRTDTGDGYDSQSESNEVAVVFL